MENQNFQSKKFFLYARKSTDSEDRQVRSIDDQIAELKELAAKENFEIVKTFIEKQTAKEPGRPIFNEMLASIESGKARGILAWHPDRLARNSIDGGKIIYFLDTQKIKSLKFPTFWFENTPQGKFMLQIAFGQSKYYVDNLSENIKRGIRQKLKNGIWPQMAPLGYLNDKNTRTIIVDKNKARLIKKAFEIYATGKYSLRELRKTINNLGLIGRKNKELSISNYQYFLKNPIYYGVIRYKNELYEGKHEPIIAKKLFDNVQEVMKQKSKLQTKQLKYFLYRGFFRCCKCGYTITADRKIKPSGKEYVYYYCTRKNPEYKCPQNAFMREEKISEQIRNEIQKVSLPDNAAEKIINELKKEKKQTAALSNSFAQKIEKEIFGVEAKLEKLMTAYLENALTLSEYQEIKNKLIEQKQLLKDRKTFFEQKRNNWFEPAINFVKSANYAQILAKNENLENQRDFFKKCGSNFQILDQKLIFDFKNPWKILAQAEPSPILRRKMGLGEATISAAKPPKYTKATPKASQLLKRPNWRRGWDSNPRVPCETNRFRGGSVMTASVPLQLN